MCAAPMAKSLWALFLCLGSRKGCVETLLDVNDLAALLKVSVAQVRELSRTRTQQRSLHPLPAIKFSRKVTRYRRSDIERWILEVAQSSRPSEGNQHQ
jgi:hypothetical protein